MLDMIATVAGLLGVSAKEVGRIVAQKNRDNSKKLAAEHRARQELFASCENLGELLRMYYVGRESSSDLRQYRIACGGEERRSTMFTRNSWLGLHRDQREVSVRLNRKPRAEGYGEPVTTAIRRIALPFLARAQLLNLQLWDDPLYLLLSATSEPPLELEFQMSNFFAYRFGSALLGDELLDALVAAEGDALAAIRRQEELLPLRAHLLPSIRSLEDYGSRTCGGGTGVLVALARREQKDFVIPIQQRSPHVADGQGRLSLIPKAFHQPHPASRDVAEVGLYWTVLRELFEELLGGKEAEREGRIKHDWYLNQNDAARFLHERNDAVRFEMTAFGINAFNGNYEFCGLVVVEDEEFWDRFGWTLKPNWEVTGIQALSSLDSEDIHRRLVSSEWAPESLLQFGEGLRRLQAIGSERCAIPRLESLI